MATVFELSEPYRNRRFLGEHEKRIAEAVRAPEDRLVLGQLDCNALRQIRRRSGGLILQP
jgi:hypothetical protein